MTDQAMPDEGFLQRWSRRKTETRRGLAPAPEADAMPAPVQDAVTAPLAAAPAALATMPAQEHAPAPQPTLDDVAQLDADSDFSAFVARGVDQAVRRTALRKLFADPHFNVMDGLDVYIDDYTRPSPVSEAMLASLEHAKSALMRTVEQAPEEDDGPGPQAAGQPEVEVEVEVKVVAAPEAQAPRQTRQPDQETR